MINTLFQFERLLCNVALEMVKLEQSIGTYNGILIYHITND
jgi:hypothetical protein